MDIDRQNRETVASAGGWDTVSWDGDGSIVADGESLVWRPADRIAQHVPSAFELRLRDLTANGMRLILPEEGFATRDEQGRLGPSAFLVQAQLGGLAALITHGLPDEHRQMQDTAWLYVWRMLNSGAWLRRQFSGALDFKVNRPFQDEFGLTSLIPAAMDGQPMTIERLFQIGNEEATRRGISEPSRQEAIHLGLVTAARRDPLRPEELNPDEINRIVRAALLDQNAAPTDVTDDELEIVSERFADAVEPHLADGTEEFDRWFLGPQNSLVKQIAQRKKARGGALEHKRVSAALTELGWRGLRQRTTCIEIQMRCVAASLPRPLDSDDLARFETIYAQQDWLGGLSLCMFGERFSFLRDAAWALVDPADEEDSKGTLLRMLQYYGTASTFRREVDRVRHRTRRSGSLKRSRRDHVRFDR